jgi:hypothetical protein
MQTMLWLHWRLRLNQFRRGGVANLVIWLVLVVAACVLALGLFVIMLVLGLGPLAERSSLVLLFVWNGMLFIFLLIWTIGVLADLQRAEVLSLDKFLHLPVSLTSAFVINYLNTLVSLSLLLFGSAMLGLLLGLTFSRTLLLLLLLPLLAAFVFLVTALTYQFQGWLASLMVNQRRRRTILVVLSTLLVLLSQSFQLLNLWNPASGMAKLNDAKQQEKEQLDAALARHDIRFQEYQKRQEEIEIKYEALREQAKLEQERVMENFGAWLWLADWCVPFGWLPLGAVTLGEGTVWPTLLGTLGLTALGGWALRRSYRTTMRIYTGQFTAGPKSRGGPATAPPAPPKPTVAQPAYFLEGRIPLVSEQTSAIALCSLRSLLRAPETKMLLLTPVIAVIVFGIMLSRRSVAVEKLPGPLMGFGAMAMILFSFTSILVNQFGFDRDGFRVYVLCAAPRRDILLGKNLAVAPLAFGLAAPLVLLVELLRRMPALHFVGLIPQMISMYLLFCMVANGLSILSPIRIAAGTFKPASPRGLAVLLQLVFMFVFPLILAPALLPLGVEYFLTGGSPGESWLICVVLPVVECGVILLVYLLVMRGLGALLQAREQQILEVVTAKRE